MKLEWQQTAKEKEPKTKTMPTVIWLLKPFFGIGCSLS
jgi:hypothetical protein